MVLENVTNSGPVRNRNISLNDAPKLDLVPEIA